MRQSWLARTLRLTVLLLSLDLVLAMRIVLQRVKSASVTVEDAVVSSIGRGVLALVGLREGDTTADLEYCAKKLCAAKLWENEEGKGWRKAARQLDYELLLASHFGETSWRSPRPNWLSRGCSRRQITPRLRLPRAPASLGQPAAWAALAGHVWACFQHRSASSRCTAT